MSQLENEYLALPATAISDALQGLNNLDPAIKPLKDSYKIAGRAFTVKIPVGDNLAVLRAIREARPGDIVVIDAKGDTYRAVAGDFVIGLAQTLGIQGFVVDGAIRDVQAIKDLNFPVFCRGTTVAASGKAGSGETNVPISCGGVSIQPGDIIVGDVDGVVAVPQTIEREILRIALNKLDKDRQRERQVAGSREAALRYLDDILAK